MRERYVVRQEEPGAVLVGSRIYIELTNDIMDECKGTAGKAKSQGSVAPLVLVLNKTPRKYSHRPIVDELVLNKQPQKRKQQIARNFGGSLSRRDV